MYGCEVAGYDLVLFWLSSVRQMVMVNVNYYRIDTYGMSVRFNWNYCIYSLGYKNVSQ